MKIDLDKIRECNDCGVLFIPNKIKTDRYGHYYNCPVCKKEHQEVD